MNHPFEFDAGQRSNARLVGYGIVFVTVFALAWLLTFGWQNRALLIDLYYQSNLERYLVATGEVGPVTFHVYHNDFQALEQLSHSDKEILGIEMTRNRKIAAMAFTSHEADAINQIRQHPAVSRMLRRNIPMICH